MYIPMIDWLSVTIDIIDYESVSCSLLESLNELKNEAIDLRSKHSEDKVCTEIGSQTFEVKANGSSGYSYILHNQLLELRLAKYRSKNEQNFPIYAHIKSEMLWLMGPEKSWLWLVEWINQYIGIVSNDKLNRVDICCHSDSYGFSITDLDRFSGRYRKDAVHRDNRNFTGFEFGSRASDTIVARIYNKSKETIDKKNKLWFFEIWEEHGLNVALVWNIEFELHRKLLKEIQVESCSKLFNNLKSIWSYLTGNWFVMHTDNSLKPEERILAQEWLNLQKAFEDYKGESFITRKSQTSCKIESLVDSAMGYLTSYSALTGLIDPTETIISLIEYGMNSLQRRGKNYTEIAVTKSKLYAVNGGDYN